jgi:hypothetical protein
MHFMERDEGEYRIYTGAIEAPRSEGYLAALVVQRLRDGMPAEEVFRDEALCAGYGWPTADAALAFAMRKAQGVTRAKQPSRPQRRPASAAASASGRPSHRAEGRVIAGNGVSSAALCHFATSGTSGTPAAADPRRVSCLHRFARMPATPARPASSIHDTRGSGIGAA